MARRTGWSMVRAFCWSTVGSSGNSSGSVPRILNSDIPHLMFTIYPWEEKTTTSSGILRTISPKRRADSTREPGSVTSAGTETWMPVSRLYPVSRRPSLVSIRMPSMAGMELLTATAREATVTAVDRSAFSQENFIVYPSVFSPQGKRKRI